MDSLFSNVSWLFSLQNLSQPLADFMDKGGMVMWWLAGVVVMCWLLVTERIIYIVFYFPKQRRLWIDFWLERADHSSWHAHAVRSSWLAQARIALTQNLNLIKVLVAICPMLGLLGTVTGMITVFDVMSTQGSSNPKLMASGISLATLSTLAGMVAALAGMFVHARLAKKCRLLELKLEKSLRSQR